MNIFVLDACALIAYLAKENGAENIIRNGQLITSDHHEFEIIEKNESVGIKWFR
jgi:PIN domain nuclease of toxin-antitoxin system